MRDVLLVVFMVGLLPLLMWRPTWGALAWVWWGIMNPHRLAWGFAQTIPFAQAIFVVTALGALFSREPKRLKGGTATFVLLLFVGYMIFTTTIALVPDKAWPMLERAIKVQIGTLMALTLLYRRDHVVALVWVIVLSIGFYAIKGGVFTLFTLGQYRVWGPEDSFIADNNAFALATVMSIPLVGLSLRSIPIAAMGEGLHRQFGRFVRGFGAGCAVAWRRGGNRRDGTIPLVQEQEQARCPALS